MIALLLFGEMAFRMGCLLSVMVMVSIVVWSAWHTLEEGVRYLKQLHQIPCSRCIYFTGDHRLKCPVHPIIALTEEAIACRDYEAREIPLYPIASHPVPKLSSAKPISKSVSLSPISQSSVRKSCLNPVVSASSDRSKS